MENKVDKYHLVLNPCTQKMMDVGEEIVISGMAGRYPESDNLKQLQENLINGIDLVTDDARRWKSEHLGASNRLGKVNNIDKFDADFFGVKFDHAHAMDPMARMLMEHAYEAVIDAGINPQQLRGTKTGVFIGTCVSESAGTLIYDKLQVKGSPISGCSKSMFANRISHCLGITGPSYTLDTACSSSLYAMEQAYRSIRDGCCEAALVGACHLCLHPRMTSQFIRLGISSPAGECRSFDDDGTGYVRSEAITIAFLQKSKNAKRIYATLVHAKTNCDGFKEEGITFPSSVMQSALYTEFYKECNIAPNSLAYIECHGTGTKVGDRSEVDGIDNVFCSNRKIPLKIGSVKSNLGHAEPASGMCAVAKIIIANETGMIPPNLHYARPREGIKGLEEGRIQVSTELMPWEGGHIGINSFGFGGANAHVLLRSNLKNKINGGAPQDDLPRLVAVSGRTEEAVETILQDIENRTVDVDYVKLLHDIHVEHIPGHMYRGYTILENNIPPGKQIRKIQNYLGVKRPIWFVFSGMGSHWAEMSADLLRFPVFANAIEKCNDVLKPRSIDIYDIITNPNKSTLDNVLNSCVGIAALQIGLVDLLKSLNIVPDNIIGYSEGELGCAYADGCFTAGQMILAAYYRGLASLEANKDHESYDSRYITNIGSKLLEYLKGVIPNPKPRSRKWVSTSVPQNQWTTPEARFSSAEYHSNNFSNTVLFEETSSMISKNAVIVEITPHSSLQAIMKRSLHPTVTNIALTEPGHKNSVKIFLQAIGKLYDVGLQPMISNLYPEVQLPVSRGTPMISPLIKWDHTENWYVISDRQKEISGVRTVEITFIDEDYAYLADYIIDGRNVLPATGYLLLVWETLSMMKGEWYMQYSVVFRDIKFLRTTTLPKQGTEVFTVMIQKRTGTFEVVAGGTVVVTGHIHHTRDPSMLKMNPPTQRNEQKEEILAKDFYKELRLRGYQYKGSFKGIKSATTTGSKGTITWCNNWVTFIDAMLQIQIFGLNSRNLCIPTGIQKLVIDTKMHIEQARSMSSYTEFDVYCDKTLGSTIAGGIEMQGLQLSVISRKTYSDKPVLESYKFVAHHDRASVSLTEAVRVATHIAVENLMTMEAKTLELFEKKENSMHDLLSPIILKALSTIPVIRADVGILTNEDTVDEDLPQDISILNLQNLPTNMNALLVSGYNLLTQKKPELMTRLLRVVKDGGFVLTIESANVSDCTTSAKKYNLNIVFEKTVNNSILLLLREQRIISEVSAIVRVNNDTFTWVDELKSALKVTIQRECAGARIIVVGENQFDNGVLGLVNCLRKEPGGEMVRGFLIQDEEAPHFSLSNPLYMNQLNLDLALNVLRSNGTWGSYRHQPLSPVTLRPCSHAWVIQSLRDDLSSFQWIEGPIQAGFKHPDLVCIVYAALNFRDVMFARGKFVPEIVPKMRIQEECVHGIEYSGVDSTGHKIMGLIPSRALTNQAVIDRDLSWYVPKNWTLEDAATVPCVYATSYYALYLNGNMKKGDKVLIHTGAGGVGQAAITLALNEGCEVFTTVGTLKKRRFIHERFPQIPDNHIGYSRDTSFEQLILEQTNGRGVDIVLNSLAGEKLQASIRCLAVGGKFLEIGEFDMTNDNEISMMILHKGISFYGILLEQLFNAPSEQKTHLKALLQRGLDDGSIKPLIRIVFPKNRVDEAFRFMAADKHIGKVVINVLDERNLNDITIAALPRYHCLPDRSYVILGGLGGFGLEVADWLILRGARNLIITSRSGLKNGYQLSRVALWRSMGIHIEIVTGKDAANHKECAEILKSATDVAPVDAIFNLTLVLEDGLLENQTSDRFKQSFKPKAWSTKVIDELSRTICPQLRHFVVFSSNSCSRGNSGQTNYGMSNSVMERICEKRVAEGLSGLAIQWGPIGDVGVLTDVENNDNELVIAGALQQKILSCLQTLDQFLTQNEPVVSSIVVAEKEKAISGHATISDAVLNIMSMKDFKTISDQTSLSKLGMDSIMAVEIQKILEHEFGVYLTAGDIRNLNFAKLLDMDSQIKN